MSGQSLRRGDGHVERRYRCANHEHRPGPHATIKAGPLEEAVRETTRASLGGAKITIGSESAGLA